MPSLYERLMGVHPDRPKIPVHQFQAVAGQWARGSITGAQAQAAVASVSDGVGLDATEQLEAQDLVDTITVAIPVTGSATSQADARARRAIRWVEIDGILLLADSRTPPYDTPAAVRAALGVPTR